MAALQTVHERPNLIVYSWSYGIRRHYLVGNSCPLSPRYILMKEKLTVCFKSILGQQNFKKTNRKWTENVGCNWNYFRIQKIKRTEQQDLLRQFTPYRRQICITWNVNIAVQPTNQLNDHLSKSVSESNCPPKLSIQQNLKNPLLCCNWQFM